MLFKVYMVCLWILGLGLFRSLMKMGMVLVLIIIWVCVVEFEVILVRV